jgi:hypothetical protein
VVTKAEAAEAEADAASNMPLKKRAQLMINRERLNDLQSSPALNHEQMQENYERVMGALNSSGQGQGQLDDLLRAPAATSISPGELDVEDDLRRRAGPYDEFFNKSPVQVSKRQYTYKKRQPSARKALAMEALEASEALETELTGAMAGSEMDEILAAANALICKDTGIGSPMAARAVRESCASDEDEAAEGDCDKGSRASRNSRQRQQPASPASGRSSRSSAAETTVSDALLASLQDDGVVDIGLSASASVAAH